MDCKILSVGKYDFEFQNQNLQDSYSSGCYFDWINIEKIFDKKENLLDNICNYEKILECRAKIQKGLHVQESMLLMSNEENGEIFDNSDILYISMINLPMCDERLIADGVAYSKLHNETMHLIKDLVKQYASFMRVYHTFDHCDFILICDGNKISINDYMKIVKEIRALTLEVSNETISIVHDVTTIYGYKNTDISASVEFENDKINLVVSLSLKSYEYIDVFIKKLKQDCSIPKPHFSTDIAGRYDHMLFWNDISLEQVNKIRQFIHINQERFFATRMHIGPNDKDNVKSCDVYDNHSSLLKNAEDRFSKEKIEKLQSKLEQPLLLALKEIHRSICTMIQRGFAQYYILCFYESFYSFVDYLSNDKYMQAEDEDEQKRMNEKIYDMYRTYFAFLNALNASTIHSERQFLQIDSYHIMYFDTPPKLIAFYTAIANKMAKLLNGEKSKNKYTFLITPDFKKDISVESLTLDKTMGDEHNILIIHMNEKSMYDIKGSIKILAHEIAHHIGQNKSLRNKRADSYMKTFLAWSIANSFEDGFLLGKDDEEKYKFFKEFINNLYLIIFDEDWKQFLEKYSGKISFEEIEYYTDYLLNAFCDYLSQQFANLDNDCLLTALNKTTDDVLVYVPGFLNGFWNEIYKNSKDKTNNEILNEFAAKNVMDRQKRLLTKWILENIEPEAYSAIVHVFRESYADARMLALISEEDNMTDAYCKMFDEKVFYDMPYEEQIRFISVLTHLNSSNTDKHPRVEKFEETGISSKSDNSENKLELQKCLTHYLCEQTIDYLGHLKDSDNDVLWINQNDIIEDIKTFDTSDINAIIQRIDYEIYEYRKRLLSEN